MLSSFSAFYWILYQRDWAQVFKLISLSTFTYLDILRQNGIHFQHLHDTIHNNDYLTLYFKVYLFKITFNKISVMIVNTYVFIWTYLIDITYQRDWAQVLKLISPSTYTYLEKFDISYNMHYRHICPSFGDISSRDLENEHIFSWIQLLIKRLMFLSALHICKYDNCSYVSVHVYVYTIYCNIKTKSTDAVNLSSFATNTANV